MPTYVIIDTAGDLDANIEGQFSDQDRCKAASRVWFVRSQRLTSSEVADDLGIAVGSRSGIVVTANHYAGAAHRGIVEKLAAWEAST